MLAFTVLNEGFAAELAGRANTALNLRDVRRQLRRRSGASASSSTLRARRSGVDTAGGLRLAFALVLVAATSLTLRVVRAAAGGGMRAHELPVRAA